MADCHRGIYDPVGIVPVSSHVVCFPPDSSPRSQLLKRPSIDHRVCALGAGQTTTEQRHDEFHDRLQQLAVTNDSTGTIVGIPNFLVNSALIAIRISY